MTFDARNQPGAKCRTCGYELLGLSDERCPECGSTFQPGDRDSVAMPLPRTVRGSIAAAGVLILFALGLWYLLSIL